MQAELSRHAYESATKQLINFLETIKSTLSIVDSATSFSANGARNIPEMPFPPPLLQSKSHHNLISNFDSSPFANNCHRRRSDEDRRLNKVKILVMLRLIINFVLMRTKNMRLSLEINFSTLSQFRLG